ncbi:MAG: tripartite tricarboxylate transporter substrate binding protein [Betaproteobacteria bacterium]|nr:MAG: tripartite tricarboxylate transporter substrate binding protein [Betaproteobacteria bacterium]
MIPAWQRRLAAALLFAAAAAWAQSYPSHTIKVVVPYGPGSSPDSVGRIVAQQMQEALGQPVIVANVAGALANVGTAEVARAAPDGYTILLTTNTPHAANVALFKSLPFDPVKDFAPIVRLITTSMVLLVRSDFPASTLDEFIAYAKKKPGGLAAGYGSAATIVSIAKLRTAAGFKTLDVAYKGVPLAITDVLGGQVDFTLGDFAVAIPQIRGGKMKGLAVTSPQRTPLAPELPAIAETFPGFETRIWYGLVAPANTPKPVVAKVHDVVSASLAKPDVKAKLAGLGLEPAPLAPEEFAAFIKQEIAKWTREIRDAGIEPQ